MNLGNLHVSPSKIVLGCEPLGGVDWGNLNIKETRNAVKRAVELGINTFDTADVYGLGQSEIELSKALGASRHEVNIITKFGVKWHHGLSNKRAATTKDSSPKYLISALEASLKRLRVEAIPIYLVHWPDASTPLEKTVEALEGCRKQGKVLSYGVSNFLWKDVSKVKEKYPLHSIELPYSLLEDSRFHSSLIQAGQHGLYRFGYGCLGQGLLSGKYNRQSIFKTNDRRHRLKNFSKIAWARNTKMLDMIEGIAIKYNKTIPQVAIRWVLDSGLIDSAIVGAKSPSQVEKNIGALGWSLDPEDFIKLSEVQ